MWWRAAIVALSLVTFVAGLGDAAVQDSDEAYYIGAGREMVASGDWLVPTYNFEPRLNKPILYYWLIAGTYRVAGVSEGAARLWSGLAGVGLALIAFTVARRFYGIRAGSVAGAIVATSFGLVPIARQSLPDVPLAFFVSLAVWAGLEALTSSADATGRGAVPSARARASWLYLAAAATALGVLTKGPVAVVLFVVVLGPVFVWEWRTRRASGESYAVPVGFFHLAVAAAVFLLIAIPWYAMVTHARGVEYLHQFLVGENIERFGTTRFNTWRGWDYLPIVIGGLLPWSAFGLLWIRPGVEVLRGRRPVDSRDVHLLFWAMAPLAFFFVSVGNQPRYILPCLVPLAILLGRTIDRALERRDILFTVATALAGAIVAACGALIVRARPVLDASGADGTNVAGIATMAAGAAIVAGALLLPRRWVPVMTTIGAAIAMVAFERTMMAPGRPEPVEVVAAAARDAGLSPSICACGAFARSLTFYTGVPTVIANTDGGAEEVISFLTTDERLLAVVDEDTLRIVEARLGTTFQRLKTVTYLNTSAWQRPSFLTRPDPSWIQRVVLIRNR